jgi:hypothetical protein
MPMKKPSQHLIAEVRRNITKVGMTNKQPSTPAKKLTFKNVVLQEHTNPSQARHHVHIVLILLGPSLLGCICPQ